VTRRAEPLLVVEPSGHTRWTPNTYEGIKAGLGGATLAFLRVNTAMGYFLDDNGMLTGQPLNVAASWWAGRPIYGPIVLAAPDTDDEGETLPCDPKAAAAMAGFADTWWNVTEQAARLGQDLTVRPNADTIPPPVVVMLPDDWQPGDPWPEPPGAA